MGPLALTLLLPLAAQAWPPTFGPEWTFMVKGRGRLPPVEGGRVQKAQLKLVARFRALCAKVGCRIEEVKGNYITDYRVTYPDGWYLTIGADNGVVEVQGKPTTAAEFGRIKDRVQSHLFDEAARAGLKPDPDGTGGGHVHIGLDSAFEGDSLLFRNFLVDSYNHYDTFERVLGEDDFWTEARRLTPAQKAAFEAVIRDFDEGRISGIEGLSKAVNERVYAPFPKKGVDTPEREQAVNLLRILSLADPESRTVELRNIRPQRTAEEYSALADLFEARLAHLKGLGRPLEVAPANAKAPLFLAWREYVHAGGRGPAWGRLAGFQRGAADRKLSEILLPADLDALRSRPPHPEALRRYLGALVDLAADPKWEVRRDAVSYAGSLLDAGVDERRLWPIVERGLADPRLDVRRAAVERLGDFRNEGSLKAIGELVQGAARARGWAFMVGVAPRVYLGEHQAMRAKAAAALVGRTEPEALELAKLAARDGNPAVRAAGKAVLGEPGEGGSGSGGGPGCLARARHRLAWKLGQRPWSDGIELAAALGTSMAILNVPMAIFEWLNSRTDERRDEDGRRAIELPALRRDSLHPDEASALGWHAVANEPNAVARRLAAEWKRDPELLRRFDPGIGKWKSGSELAARRYVSDNPEGAASVVAQLVITGRLQRGSVFLTKDMSLGSWLSIALRTGIEDPPSRK